MINDENRMVELNYYKKLAKNLINNKTSKEKNEEQIRFEKEINDTINNLDLNSKDRFNEIKVCDTPKILIDCGMNNLPMLYRKRHLRDAIKEKNEKKHHHGLTIEQIYNLPKNISEPAIILKNKDSNKQNCPIVVLNDVDDDKLPIFVVVEMNTKGVYELKNINTNDILSIYGRKNFEEYLNKVVEKDGLIFYDKEKVHNLDIICGLQLSTRCINYEPNKILQQIKENVNNKIEKNDKKSEGKNMKEKEVEEPKDTIYDLKETFDKYDKFTYDTLLEKYNFYTHGSKLGQDELNKAFENKSIDEKIIILQNKVAKFEPVETNQINKNTLKL